MFDRESQADLRFAAVAPRLADVRREKGCFRSFLRAAMEHFLANGYKFHTRWAPNPPRRVPIRMPAILTPHQEQPLAVEQLFGDVAHMSLPAIIEFTKTDPTAYLGRTGHSYASLVGFINGYVFGVRYTVGDLSRQVLPSGFNDYVRNTLNNRHASSKYGADDHWTEVILQEAGSDEAAFSLFYELWDSFNQVRSG